MLVEVHRNEIITEIHWVQETIKSSQESDKESQEAKRKKHSQKRPNTTLKSSSNMSMARPGYAKEYPTSFTLEKMGKKEAPQMIKKRLKCYRRFRQMDRNHWWWRDNRCHIHGLYEGLWQGTTWTSPQKGRSLWHRRATAGMDKKFRYWKKTKSKSERRFI